MITITMPGIMKRRQFIKQTSLLSTVLLAANIPLPAHIYINDEDSVLLKKIDPAWVKSLYNRGSVTTYLKSRNELQYIGMPVGGINCGMLYAGGDGRLWLWDIFNETHEGVETKTIKWSEDGKDLRDVHSRDGACYVEPAKNIRPLDQGFAIKIETGGKSIIKKLEEQYWDEISFEATYPVATVHYRDAQLPLEIKLEMYSPFIALDEFNSGLPATVLSFSIKNTGTEICHVTILGWLENKAAIHSAKEDLHERVNTSFKQKKLAAVQGTVRSKAGSSFRLQQLADFGSLCIASLNDNSTAITNIALPVDAATFAAINNTETIKTIPEKLTGAVTHQYQLLPGKQIQSDFLISWHFPNAKIEGVQGSGRFYQTAFNNALSVASYIEKKLETLSAQTKLFKQTWYDSTLPWWFLERSFLNISTLATTTCHRFSSGRFWAWEGTGACPGNCTHVWQYAQAVGRVFPALEKDTRERVDLGISLLADGGISFRAESESRPAIDGQAGTILRFYREHQMSADNTFLQSNWYNIKKTIQFVINKDKNGDGMEDTPLENTLDAIWDGEIAWIVGLCIAAVKAGQLMAEEMNDDAFAAVCNSYVSKGSRNMEEQLFNGEYFIHQPDAVSGRKKLGGYNTSHIDQVFGQSWAFQLGLGRILNKEKTVSALRSLWKYNFTTDVGPYIIKHRGGRPYALAGEGGMIMNTNPKKETAPYGTDVSWQAGYFHECMSGFEHQVASHLMAESMVDEALILTRTIHDRYHAVKRNPFNEIECSDHYARAMASYGTFITACGFEYHGPKGYLKFAPKMSAQHFKAPFITAMGWGSFEQKKEAGQFTAILDLKYGSLMLTELQFEIGNHTSVTALLDNKKQTCTVKKDGTDAIVHFADPFTMQAHQQLKILLA
ncbi:MAG: GH116 family glycosyl-hydrolase [Chitinophagaceae bacterium]